MCDLAQVGRAGFYRSLRAYQIQIRQAAADIQPVGILREPPVPDLGPSEDPLAHQERMVDFGPAFRLRTIAGALRLA